MSQVRAAAAPQVPDEISDSMCTAAGTEADLGWALAIVTRALRLHAGSSLGDLTGGRRGYLVLKAVAEGQPRSQLALAHQLGVDKTVMTYLLDELEGAELVTRCPDPADRRVRQVAVTEKGTASLAEFGVRLAAAEERVLAPLAPAERHTLRALLGRLAQSAQSVQSIGEACMGEAAPSEGCS